MVAPSSFVRTFSSLLVSDIVLDISKQNVHEKETM